MIMMFYPIILFVTAPLSGYLSDKIGCKYLTLAGLFINVISLILLSFLDLHSSVPHIVALLALIGFGNGLFQSPNTNQIMSAVPKNKLGVAGGVNALIRNLGLVFGLSVSTSILYFTMSQKAGYKMLGIVAGQEAIFIYGMKIVYLIVAIECTFVFILSFKDKVGKIRD
jgi:MFS family permease